MRQLIAENIMLASVKPAASARIAEAAPAPVPFPFPLPLPLPGLNTAPAEQPDLEIKPQLASAASGSEIGHIVSEATATIPQPPSLGSSAPIKPIPVRTYSVKLVPAKPTTPAPKAEQPKPAAAAPARLASATPTVLPSIAAPAEAALPPAPKLAPGTWVIQIGAFEDEGEAKERLTSAQSKANGLLGKASRYTERTTKGEKTYYRARFAGFDRTGAQQACRQLKRSDIDCMAFKI
jgi:D-alanyl-D-alanine carboxypeptidase